MKTLLFLVIILLSRTAFAQPGAIDGSFNPGDLGLGDGPDGVVYASVRQIDGKIIIGGTFTNYNGTARSRIARLNADGTVDVTFNPGLGATTTVPPSPLVDAIGIQPDGKIIIGGYFDSYNGTLRNSIARLNNDGTVDLTFNPGTGIGPGSLLAGGLVRTITIQSDGKILIGGSFTSYNGTTAGSIARLNVDGSIDGAFIPGTGVAGVVESIVIQSDGKIVVGGSFNSYNGTSRNGIARLNFDGTLDGTFNPSSGVPNGSKVHSTALQSDGKIVIGGIFTSFSGVTRNGIARLNSDGTLDGTFDPGTGVGPSEVYSLVFQSDGKIIIGGDFATFNATARKYVARINTNGSLDVTFNPGTSFDNGIETALIQPDGKVILGGYFTSFNGTWRNKIARINSDGTLDATFNQGTGIIAGFNPDGVLAMCQQLDGKIILGGGFESYNNTVRKCIVRVNADGSLDATFNPGTGINNNGSNSIRTATIQTDGKIVIGGIFTSYSGTARNSIARINADGTLDGTFNPGLGANGIYTTIIQSNGKILIGGGFTSYNGTAINRIARLNADGTLDGAFNPGTGANNDVNRISIQADGKVIIGGRFTSYNGTPRNNIARLNTDGTLDGTFDPGAGANNNITEIAIQSDGKIIIGGNFNSYNGASRNNIARLNPDGNLDGTFNPGTGANGPISGVIIQPDGRIIIGGIFGGYDGVPRIGLARLNPDGTLDGTFGGGGAPSGIKTITSQADGKVIIGGQFTSYNGIARNRVARVLTGTLPGQTITFSSLPPKAPLDPPSLLTATASSGLAVSYSSSNTAVATVSGNTVTIVGIGTTTITASQAGDANYSAAPNVQQTLTVSKLNQTIAFNSLPPRLTTDPPFQLPQFSSSGLAISYSSSNTAVATVSGNTVTVTGAGTTTITAAQGGNANYNAATNVVQTLTVVPGFPPVAYRTQWGTPAGLRLNGPYGIDMDAAGANIYIADGSQVTVMNSSGTILRTFGTSGTAYGQFGTAIDIKADAAGNLYVLDFSNNNVQIFDNAGNFLRGFGSFGSLDGQFKYPRGLALDGSGNIYITDTGNNRIQIFNSNGTLLRKFGVLGSANGQFNSPRAITLDGTGNIFVMDRNNQRVQKFDNNGNFLLKFGSAGTGNGQFGSAGSGKIVVDGTGNIFVVDWSAYRVQKFDPAGNFLLTFGTQGTGSGQFNYPTGIDLDPSGNIIVADASNRNIQKFSAAGSFLATYGNPGLQNNELSYPSGVAVDAALNVYVADAEDKVKVFDKNGTFIRQFGSSGTGNGQFNFPSRVALDNAGNIFVLDQGNNRIQVFSNAGVFIRAFGSYGSANGQLDYPKDLAVDGSGNTYVANLINSRVEVFDASGNFLRNFGTNGSADGQFSSITGIAVDGAGNIYTADAGNTRVQVFSNTGTFLRKFGTSQVFSSPNDIALDPTGRIIVVDNVNQNVRVFANDGTYQFTTGSYGTQNGQFRNPEQLAIDPSGLNIFVADAGNNRIQAFGMADINVKANASSIASGGILNFGNINMSANSGAIAFSVENLGSMALNLIGTPKVSISGSNAADFSVNVSSTAATVAVASTTTFSVTFTPSAQGARTAQLSILSNDPDENPYLINLQGTGVINGQTITFNAFPLKNYGDAPFTLGATASSTLAVSYTSSNTAVATVSGNTLTIVGVGTTNITASQAGNVNFSAAVDVPQTLTVNKGNQSIIFNSLSPKVFGDPNFSLTATAGPSMPVTYTSGNTAVATISGNTVTIVGVGSTVITASQPGNANYNAATDVPQTLIVSKANQTITFNALAAKAFGDPNFDLTGSVSSNLAVAYGSSNTSVATISGNTVTIVGVGSSVITASQPGNVNYNAAVNVPQTLTVNKGNQTITFNSFAPAAIGDSPITLGPTASSGLTISYASSNSAVATVSGNVLTIAGQGNSTITASQPGNTNYNAATSVDQVLSVKQGQTITFAALPSKTFGGASFNLTATASSNLVVTYVSSNTAVATVSGNTVTIVGAGSTTITANQSGDGTFNAALPVSQSLTVAKASQTITFGAIATKTMGDAAFGVAAVSSSTLAVQYSATPSGRVTIAGNQITIVGPGSVTISADQPGNANYLAAPTVSQTFCVNPVKPTIALSAANTEAPVLTSNSSSGNQWFLNGTAIGGATNVTLTAAAPGLYTVQTKADNCTSVMSDQQALIVTGDLVSRAQQEFSISPNPTTDYVNIGGLKGETGEAHVVDLAGRSIPIVLEKKDGIYRVNVQALSEGLYLLRVQDASTIHQVKFVKK